MRRMLLLLGACLSAAGLPVRVDLRKAEDSAEISFREDSSVINISSKSGIGGARLVRLGKQWPALVIRLNLKGLESFQMDNGTLSISGSVSTSGKQHWKVGKKGLELKVTQSAGSFEIVVPKEMLEGNPEAIQLSWIDFYR